MNLPTKIQGYQFIKQLGEGATAHVYQAIDLKTKEKVAIKKMKKMNFKDNQMMKQQIATMKKFNHDNIVKFIKEFKDSSGQWFIVLQHCQYGDLDNYKKKVGKVPEFHVKLYAKGIIQGLKAMHKQNIAHRDLKPSNILIGKNYRLKLADFGFSKDCNKDMTSFKGTPIAMAPQIISKSKYTNKCDIWAFGVLLYMLFYNKAPFMPAKGDGGLEGVFRAILKGQLYFDPKVKVSDHAIALMKKCLSADQKYRPSSNEIDKDPWFHDLDYAKMSALRVNAISEVIRQEPQILEQKARNMAKQTLYGSFDCHLKKLSAEMSINTKIIEYILQNLNDEKEKKIRQYYSNCLQKKLQQFSKRQVIFEINNLKFILKLKDIKLFNQYVQQIKQIIKSYKIQQIEQKVNYQRQISKFIVDESQKILQEKNQDIIDCRINLLKYLINFISKDYNSTVIIIKWGERNDLEKYTMPLFTVFEQIYTEPNKVNQMINENVEPSGDLQTIWLIEHNIKENIKQNKTIDAQLIKTCYFILDQPAIFKMQRPEQHLQMSEYFK